ncbi:LacI family DNA-binding transcriptional regulator, partial [Streptomyces reticuliscabiei]
MTRVVGRNAGSPAPRSVDVAQVAGVSRKTVSRVLNNEPYVSD